MKFDAAKVWHFSLLVFIVCGVVFALALRFWLQAPLYAQFPDPFKY